jgi:translation initiation factor 1 (eIF-1/SUI1)
MARAAKKHIDGRGDLSLGSAKSFGVPIGNVLGQGAVSAEKSVPAPRGETAGDDGDKTPHGFLKSVSRAILRRESAGRGGRTVTSVELRPAPDNDAAGEVAKIMRKSLGCGSHVESRKIILQGDIVERAALWLEKQGVREITRNV